MKIQLWSIGKTHENFVKEGIELFTNRINNYFSLTWNIIPGPKNAGQMEPPVLKLKEGEIVVSMLMKDDFLVLLDERGKSFTSEAFAKFLEQKTVDSLKNIVFLIGGAYGVSEEVKQRANFIWKLSDLVFPHQLVRLIATEQIYRACSIIRNEKYHHA